MNKKLLTFLAVSTLTASSFATSDYSCAQLPNGSYNIGAFATYNERQKNPEQKDISGFKVMSISGNTVYGTVMRKGITYSFSATCKSVIYNNVHELKLIFNTDSDSGLNKCSGIFNFHTKKLPFAEAMYLGCPSLITGDNDFQACEGGRYGAVSP